MKRFTILLLALTLVLSILTIKPITSEASTTYSATVNTDSLNVREKESAQSKKLGSIKKGTKVTVYVKNKNGWATIKFKNKKAYVSAKYLTYNTSQSSNKELKDLRKYALKGTTPYSSKIKLGDNPQNVINTYGKTEGWGMREYYVLEYKNFSTTYPGLPDGTGQYPYFNKSTEIYNISSKLNKFYTIKELRSVFGNEFNRGYDSIPGEIFVTFDLGKYTIYFIAEGYFMPDESEKSLSKMKFKKYSLVNW